MKSGGEVMGRHDENYGRPGSEQGDRQARQGHGQVQGGGGGDGKLCDLAESENFFCKLKTSGSN